MPQQKDREGRRMLLVTLRQILITCVLYYENDKEDKNDSFHLIKVPDGENITDNIVNITPSLDTNISDSQPFLQHDMENSSSVPIATNIEILMLNSTQN